ncbi:MAG TPA: rod shape-determining protein [Desulfotomaculum sp.]|jgi:rod shape-determining protein MreB|nr:rod shape-determining protein [Desulfotomaculum sp.]HCJ78511.1 rod shape-determining protein [Desulfotomaculum sp.]
MLGSCADIGIDLGTANVLVYVKGKGITLREPSVVAINKDNKKIIAVGAEARRMLGRTPGNIIAIRPLRGGVITNFEVTEKMLSYFIKKTNGRKLFFRPKVMICIPTGITGVEERAVREAAIQAGARQAYLIEEPLAAALGASLDISSPKATMVVDIGGGTTDIAVLSLGGIVCCNSLRVGGDKLDEAIIRYVRREFNLAMGEQSAEEIKINIATACLTNLETNISYEVRGRDLTLGLPRSVQITRVQVYEAIKEPLAQVVSAVKDVLERTPPELAADIVNKGIVMTGGSSLLHNIDTLLKIETKLPVYVAEDPISCVALGTGKALSMLKLLSGNIRNKCTYLENIS